MKSLAETLPKRLSLTDPQARWTAAPGGPAFYAYSTNYLIDTEHGVIVDVEPTPAHRMAEVESTKVMIDRVEAQFDIKPERLIGDTAYGTASMLAWTVEAKASSRMHAGRCGAEPATTGQIYISRATAHWISASALSKKPQTNPITEQQRSTKSRQTTQRGE
jgi:hypothetical protein